MSREWTPEAKNRLGRQVPTLDAIRAEQCRRSLAKFVKYGWHVNEPTTPLIWNWHIDAICEHLQILFEDWEKAKSRKIKHFRQRLKNLVINIPPGTMKSRVVNVLFPAWVWLKCPSFRFLCLSADEGNVLRDAVFARQVIESDWYQQWFAPTWRMSAGENAKGYYTNSAGGSRISQAYGARVTGKRADAILTDDPHDAQEVLREVARKEDSDRWDTAIENRVNDPEYSFRVLMMQRLHVDDLSGHLLKRNDWAHLRLPMKFENAPYCKCADCLRGETPIGFKDKRCEEGDLLFPDRFPPEVVAAEEKRLGAYGAAGQLQQRPVPEGGAFFERQWLKIEDVPPTRFKRLVRYYDLAGAAPGKGDWTVGCLMGQALPEDGGKFWVLHVLRFQLPANERDAAIKQQCTLDRQKYPAVKFYIEQVPGLGKESVEKLVLDLAGFSVTADRVGTDKVTRAEPLKSQCNGNNVRIVADEKWNEEFIETLALFPNAPHDDDVDAASGAFNRIVMVPDVGVPASGGAMAHIESPQIRTGVPMDTRISGGGGRSGFGNGLR